MRQTHNNRKRHIIISALLTVMMLVVSCVVSFDETTSYAASGKPAKPSISSLTVKGQAITVKSKKRTGIDGYQVQYSTSQKFKSKKSVTVKTKKLNKTIGKLKKGSVYYVKIRTFKKKDGKKDYSSWSAVKNIAIPVGTIYTSDVWTTLFAKKSSASKSIKVWYRTPLKVVKVFSVSGGKWTKVTFRNSTYYLWESKGSPKTVKSVKKKYTSTANNDLQNQVVTTAMKIYNNWNTKYDYSHSATLGKKASDGKYAFDCSGFASYVLNSVMQKSCPAYNISRGDEELYETTSVLNKGLTGEFNAQTVCKGKPDYSKLKPGDVLFFKEESGSHAIDHVGIYLGNKEFIQSTKMYQRYPGDKTSGRSTGGVCIAPLPGKYAGEFVAAKRFIPAKFTPANVTKTVKDSTGLYAGNKCNDSKGNERISSLQSGDKVKVLYTIRRADGRTVAYVAVGSEKGFILGEKLS